MLRPNLLLLLWVLSFSAGIVNGKFGSAEQEDKLVSYLQSVLTVHSPHRDMVNSSVYPTIDLYQILNVDENSEQLTVKYLLSFYYYVTSAAWDKSEYNNVGAISFPPDTFWSPGMVNEDLIEEIQSSEDKQTVRSDGQVVASSVITVFTCSCKFEYALFPFDTQHCAMTISAWGYSVDEFRIRFDSTNDMQGEASLEYYISNPQWHVKRPLTYEIQTYESEDGVDRYDKIRVKLVLERDPVFYLSVLILPSFGIYILSSFVFILPAQSGEKITFASAIFLAQIFTLGAEVSAYLPRSSDHFPIFGNYMIVMVLQMAFSIIITIFTYNVFFTGNNGREVSERMQAVLRDPRLSYFMMAPANFKIATKRKNNLINEAEKDSDSSGKYQRLADPDTTGQDFGHDISSDARHNAGASTAMAMRALDQVMVDIEKTSNPNWAPLWARFAVFVDRVCFVIYFPITFIITFSYFISVAAIRS